MKHKGRDNMEAGLWLTALGLLPLASNIFDAARGHAPLIPPVASGLSAWIISVPGLAIVMMTPQR